MVPDAPVINFRLPMFGDNGYKTWDLQGGEGHYISENRMDVKEMVLQIFSGDERILLESTISSPYANILINESKARGENGLKVVNEDFQITGENWEWDGKTRNIKISKNVNVVLFEEIDYLLE